MQLQYIIFLTCAFVLFFIFVRASVIDFKTEYVPDNIVIGVYLCSIIYILLESILSKTYSPIKVGLIGFGMTFIIPYILSYAIYYFRYYSWKIANKGKELPLLEEEDLKENPYISKKSFYITYTVGIVAALIIGLVIKNYFIIKILMGSLIIELILGKLLKRFYVIKANYAEEKFKEDTIEKEIEDDLCGGIGGGDIILFGAIGLMFGILGFAVTFVYATLAHIIIVISYSLIKRLNPFKYPIPFVPALTVGLLIYICGLDKYLLNMISIISSLF